MISLNYVSYLAHIIFIFNLIVCTYNLGSGILGSLSEVWAHVTLKVEIGKLISLLELEESSKLAVRVDLATILLVLKIVSTNVLVNIASNLSTSHLGTNRLLKELGKLI